MIEQDSIAAIEGRVGQYQLLERLSDSYFGPRFRVRVGTDGPERALRFITTQAPERFATAAAAIRGVRHPALLSPIELLRPARGLAVITEDVAGETLRSLLERAVAVGESIPEAVALRSALDLLEALEALELADPRAGRRPHVYGGLTLDSIHVGADGRTRLLDPGVAAVAAREPSFAQSPVRAAYTAPEQLDGDTAFDVRSDVFTVGVVLWEVLACRSLFGAASYEAVVERVLHDRVARAQRERFLRGEPVSAKLCAVVERALRRDAQRRFQSYGELSDAVSAVGRAAEHAEVARFIAGGMRSLITGNEPSAPAARAVSSAPVEEVRLTTPDDFVLRPLPPPPKLPVIDPTQVHEPSGSTAPLVLPVARVERPYVRSDLRVLVGFALVLVVGALVLWRARAPSAAVHAARPVPGATAPVRKPESPPVAHVEPPTSAAAEAAPARALPTSPSAPAAAATSGEVTPARPRPEAARSARRRPTAPARPVPHEYIPDDI